MPFLDYEDLATFLASPQARTSARGGEKKASSLNCLRASVTGFLKYLHRDGSVPEDADATIRPQSKGPKSAIRVTSYADLDQYVEAFAKGHLNLLILVGAPGLNPSPFVVLDQGGPRSLVAPFRRLGPRDLEGLFQRFPQRNRPVYEECGTPGVPPSPGTRTRWLSDSLRLSAFSANELTPTAPTA